jgi:D-alanyl-D-alanine carboxypeptidase
MKWIRRALFAGALLAAARPAELRSQGAASLADSALVRAVTSFVDAESQAGRFSGVVLVARGDTPVVTLARGNANRRTHTANTAGTRFQLASGDKWFTKIAISQLVKSGRVQLSDTVGRFLPTYPNATVRSRVTVQHLIGHRSGLGSYWNEAFNQRRESLRTLEDVVALFASEEPAFAPGERMQYSNNGYILLGRIIEIASGMSYYDYVQRNIFAPAGMTRTAYLTLDEWPSDKALGYTSGEPINASATATPPEAPLGENTGSIAFRGSSAGGGYSTAGDLLRLDQALRRGAVGDSAVLSRVTARAPGGREVLANGGGPGANVEISRVGAYTIIVLANLDPPAASRLLQHIISVLPSRAPPGI